MHEGAVTFNVTVPPSAQGTVLPASSLPPPPPLPLGEHATPPTIKHVPRRVGIRRRMNYLHRSSSSFLKRLQRFKSRDYGDLGVCVCARPTSHSGVGACILQRF